jgi:hypothetical protein
VQYYSIVRDPCKWQATNKGAVFPILGVDATVKCMCYFCFQISLLHMAATRINKSDSFGSKF